jgi:hypothetical protein
MKYIKTFKEIKESEHFTNTANDSIVEESFFRLPSNIVGNELYTASKNLNNFYDSANSGNDIDTDVLDSIIKKLNVIKKSAKKFNSAEEIKGTVFEINEAIQVNTSRYERSHGKKPRGVGMWAFYFDRVGGDPIFAPSVMQYSDAVNWAKEQSKEAGKSTIYVGESVNEGVGKKVEENTELHKELTQIELQKLKGTVEEKVIKLILNGKFPKPDPQKLLKLSDNYYVAVLKKISRIGGDSGKEMRYRTLDYTLGELENWAKARVELMVKEFGLKSDLKIKLDETNEENTFGAERAINEEKYTVIDPKGNQMGASDKMQATSIAKKNGGEAAGYFVVANKNALKARRALEKFKGDFTDPKLKDMMADLFYESVEEATLINLKNNSDAQTIAAKSKLSYEDSWNAITSYLVATMGLPKALALVLKLEKEYDKIFSESKINEATTSSAPGEWVEEEMNEKKVNISAATEELFFLWDEIVDDNRAGIESGETEHKGKSAVLFMTDTDDLANLAKWKQEAGNYIKKNGLNYKDAGNNFIIHA